MTPHSSPTPEGPGPVDPSAPDAAGVATTRGAGQPPQARDAVPAEASPAQVTPEATLEVTPEQVALEAERLAGQSNRVFAADLADHLWWMAGAVTPTGAEQHPIAHEDLVQQAAYRTPLLAAKSLRAVRQTRAQGAAFAPRLAGDSDAEHRARRSRFRRHVAHEEQLLEIIVAGLAAQQGVLRTPRNAWKRAKDRLAQLNMESDVPRGTITRLVEEERSGGRGRASNLATGPGGEPQ